MKKIIVCSMFSIICCLAMSNVDSVKAVSFTEEPRQLIDVDESDKTVVFEEDEFEYEDIKSTCLACVIIGANTDSNDLNIVATEMSVINSIIKTNLVSASPYQLAEQE